MAETPRELADQLRYDIDIPALVETQQAHPAPWHIEHDWTVEVIASDGFTVAKCWYEDDAERVVLLGSFADRAEDMDDDALKLWYDECASGCDDSRAVPVIDAELAARRVARKEER